MANRRAPEKLLWCVRRAVARCHTASLRVTFLAPYGLTRQRAAHQRAKACRPAINPELAAGAQQAVKPATAHPGTFAHLFERRVVGVERDRPLEALVPLAITDIRDGAGVDPRPGIELMDVERSPRASATSKPGCRCRSHTAPRGYQSTGSPSGAARRDGIDARFGQLWCCVAHALEQIAAAHQS